MRVSIITGLQITYNIRMNLYKISCVEGPSMASIAMVSLIFHNSTITDLNHPPCLPTLLPPPLMILPTQHPINMCECNVGMAECHKNSNSIAHESLPFHSHETSVQQCMSLTRKSGQQCLLHAKLLRSMGTPFEVLTVSVCL